MIDHFESSSFSFHFQRRNVSAEKRTPKRERRKAVLPVPVYKVQFLSEVEGVTHHTLKAIFRIVQAVFFSRGGKFFLEASPAPSGATFEF